MGLYVYIHDGCTPSSSSSMYYFLQTQRMKILSLGPDGRTRVESKLLLSYCVLLLARVCILCILASSYKQVSLLLLFFILATLE